MGRSGTDEDTRANSNGNRLSKSNLDFNDKLKVTKGIGNREIIRHEIRKNERKIKILEWVLEG